MKLIAQICFSGIVAPCLPTTLSAHHANRPPSTTSALMMTITSCVNVGRLWIKYFKLIPHTLKVEGGEDSDVHQSKEAL